MAPLFICPACLSASDRQEKSTRFEGPGVGSFNDYSHIPECKHNRISSASLSTPWQSGDSEGLSQWPLPRAEVTVLSAGARALMCVQDFKKDGETDKGQDRNKTTPSTNPI